MAAITVTARVLSDTVTTVLPGRPKRGLRGAFQNIPYIGPVLSGASVEAPPSVLHNSTINAGGVVTTDGYRELDASSPTGGEIEDAGLSAGDGAGVNSVTRPNPGAVPSTKRVTQAFTGDGVKGGSAPGAPIDTTGRATSTGVDRFGRTKGVANQGAGLGTYDYTNFDGAPTLSGDGGYAVGVGRGTITDGATASHRVARPTVGSSADPSAGTVAVVAGGSSIVQIDLHADDITGGANGLAGAQVLLFERDTDDTDEDGALIGVFDCDGGTDISTMTTLSSARTVAVYARKRYPITNGGATTYGYGPMSARATLAVT